MGGAVCLVVAGTVSLKLLGRASCGRRRVIGLWGGPKRLIFEGRASTESSCLGFGTAPGVVEGQNGSFLKAGLVQNRHF